MSTQTQAYDISRLGAMALIANNHLHSNISENYLYP